MSARDEDCPGCERLPRLLAPGEEIPPGCRAELRAAIVEGPAEALPGSGADVAALVERARVALRRLCRATATMADAGDAEEALGDLARASLRDCRAPARHVEPVGTTQQIGEAVGAAARELLAEHGAPAGVVLEVRLVRRGGAPLEQRQDVVANVRRARAVAEAAEIREAQERVDALRAGVASFGGGDRAPSPPVRLLRELREAEAVLRDLRGEP